MNTIGSGPKKKQNIKLYICINTYYIIALYISVFDIEAQLTLNAFWSCYRIAPTHKESVLNKK